MPQPLWRSGFLIGQMGNKNHNADLPHMRVKCGNGHEGPTQSRTSHLCMVSMNYHYSSLLGGTVCLKESQSGLGILSGLKGALGEVEGIFIPAVLEKFSLGN